MPDYAGRLHALQDQMDRHAIDLVFLPISANLHYLTGIPREEPNFGNTMYPGEWLTGAWIPRSGSPILTLPRMMADFHMGAIQGYEVRVLPDRDRPEQLVAQLLAQLRVSEKGAIALEDRAWAETLLNIQQLLPQASFRAASRLLMPLRRCKDEDEIAVLRRAGEITERAYAATLARLCHGMTNLDLITEVNYQLSKEGAKTHSFVTSFYNMGPNYPFDFHNRDEVLQVPLEPPVAVSFDFGAVYDGYCYDYGRSVFFGTPDSEYRRVHELVMAAQQAGIRALGAGHTCQQADAAARAVIEEGGYGSAFMHRLGHGIGLDVHEPPFLTAGDETILEPGMCFTVEPSIFIPHRLGCRVEDVVMVREDGGEALTSGYQELDVVP